MAEVALGWPIPICVFAKPPRPGSVKTRLELGGARAALLARAFFLDTWALVRSTPWAQPILAATDGAAEDFGLARDTLVWLQGDGDLGERLERVLTRALRGHPFALAIGADSPGLPRRLLEHARSALETGEAVLGPCNDGGFYLIGLTHRPQGLLRDLPWSEPDTFTRTLERLHEHDVTTRILEPWFDVDHPPDLHRLRGLIERGEVWAPETASALTRVGYPVRRGRGAVTAIGAGAIASRAPALRVSVVIPVLDEEERIAGQLAAVSSIPGVHEVIVVDGGSRDRTRQRARSFSGVRVVEAPRGRASQMNAGARLATGDVLLFLHADVGLPPDAVHWVRAALADSAVVGGAFRTWTVADGRRRWLAPLLHLADLRSRYTGLPYGDQAMFVRAEAFRQVGGFPDQPLMEDLELSLRLRRAGRIRTVPATVRVSGRRFLARPLYYGLLMNLVPLLYRLGIPPRLWVGLYGHPR